MSIKHPRENNISFWLPFLKAAKVKIPRTSIIETRDAPAMLGTEGEVDGYSHFLNQLKDAAAALGYPVFLRTGHTNAKHEWRFTSYVASAEEFDSDIKALVDYCDIAGSSPIPYQTWVVREMLDLKTGFESFYGRSPVNRERRYFFKNGRILCHHSYWQAECIKLASVPDWKQKLKQLNAESPEEVEMLTAQTLKVAMRGKGAWSIDWAQRTGGEWFAIDMALMEISSHPGKCPHHQ